MPEQLWWEFDWVLWPLAVGKLIFLIISQLHSLTCDSFHHHGTTFRILTLQHPNPSLLSSCWFTHITMVADFSRGTSHLYHHKVQKGRVPSQWSLFSSLTSCYFHISMVFLSLIWCKVMITFLFVALFNFLKYLDLEICLEMQMAQMIGVCIFIRDYATSR